MKISSESLTWEREGLPSTKHIDAGNPRLTPADLDPDWEAAG